MVIASKSEDETYEIAKKMGEQAKPGTVISLNGDLGAGKTVFTSGFAKGLGVNEVVCSPTFTIVQEYDGERLSLFHFDVYRINDPDEMYEIGFDEYIDSDGVCIIEWGDKIKDILPEDVLRIDIKKDMEKGTDFRYISVS